MGRALLAQVGAAVDGYSISSACILISAGESKHERPGGNPCIIFRANFTAFELP